MTRQAHFHTASMLRVLVVEDHAPFRKIIRSTLAKGWESERIIEASDGVEAVLMAKEFQPDLILLDFGLPTLNGIQVAQVIRELSPQSRILFVSVESSEDVVQEAFRSGARGYVKKSNVPRELLAAVEAVLSGDQFISAELMSLPENGPSGRLGKADC
jgi:DNA-binding NarL/FixJ family response regulator